MSSEEENDPDLTQLPAAAKQSLENALNSFTNEFSGLQTSGLIQRLENTSFRIGDQQEHGLTPNVRAHLTASLKDEQAAINFYVEKHTEIERLRAKLGEMVQKLSLHHASLGVTDNQLSRYVDNRPEQWNTKAKDRIVKFINDHPELASELNATIERQGFASQEDLQAAIHTISEMRSESNAIKGKVVKFQATLATVAEESRHHLKRSEEGRRRIVSLTSDLNKLQVANKGLTEQVNSLKSKGSNALTQIQSELTKLHEKLQRLDEDYIDQLGIVTILESEKSSAESLSKALSVRVDELEELDRQHSKTMAERDATMSTLQASNRAMTAEISSQKNELVLLREQHQALRATNETLVQQISEINVRVEQIDDARSQLAEQMEIHKDDYTTLHERYVALDKHDQKLYSDLTQQRQDLTSANAKVEEHKQAELCVLDLATQVCNVVQNKDVPTLPLSSSSNAQDMLKDALAACQRLISDHQRLSIELQNEKSGHRNALSLLKDAVSELHDSEKGQVAVQNQLRKDRSAMTTLVRERDHELDVSRAELESAHVAAENLEHELLNERDEQALLDTRLDKVNSDYTGAKAQVVIERGNVELLQEQLLAKDSEISNLKQDRSKLDTEAQRIREARLLLYHQLFRASFSQSSDEISIDFEAAEKGLQTALSYVSEMADMTNVTARLANIEGLVAQSASTRSALDIAFTLLMSSHGTQFKTSVQMIEQLSDQFQQCDSKQKPLVSSLTYYYLRRKITNIGETPCFAERLIVLRCFEFLSPLVNQNDMAEILHMYKSRVVRSDSLLVNALTSYIEQKLDGREPFLASTIINVSGEDNLIRVDPYMFAPDGTNMLILKDHRVAFVRPIQFNLMRRGLASVRLVCENAPMIGSWQSPEWSMSPQSGPNMQDVCELFVDAMDRMFEERPAVQPSEEDLVLEDSFSE